jgi:23S rRNA pseudouridine2605 synthase
VRLNAFLARAGLASRRKSDDLIKLGKVKVDGVVGQLNTEVDDSSKVEFEGKIVRLQQFRYILLYKPGSVLTTNKDPHGRKKVIDLVKISERVVPVGRLDWDTTGVLLLTNDGALAHQLMHPSFEVDKVYEAVIEETLTDEQIKLLSQGVRLEDGKTAPAKTRKISDHKLELTIHEGRNHQVKRMLARVGLTVTKLHRSKYGDLSVKGLSPGQWRDLTDLEVNRLKNR